MADTQRAKYPLPLISRRHNAARGWRWFGFGLQAAWLAGIIGVFVMVGLG